MLSGRLGRTAPLSRCADWQTSCPSTLHALPPSWRLVGDLGAPEIGANHMRAGIALADHYAAEALRLFGACRVNPDLRLAQRLLDWLLGSWPEAAISLPDIYQRSLNAIADKATAVKLGNPRRSRLAGADSGGCSGFGRAPA
jgi:hypothetical protein